MRKLFALFITLFCCYYVNAQTTVGGGITTNTTWNLAGSPYTVTSSVTVSNSAILTIETGVEVKFNDNLFIDCSDGTLNATGVTFTSNNVSPTAGVWSGIRLRTDVTHTLTSSQILYAVIGVDIDRGAVNLSNTSITSSSQDAIEATNALTNDSTTITADNLTISGTGTSYYGIDATKTVLHLTNSSITSVGQGGIYISGSRTTGETVTTPTSTVTNTTITDGTIGGVYVSSEADIQLTDVSITNCQYPIYYFGASNVGLSGTNTLSPNTNNYIYNGSATIAGNMRLAKAPVPYVFAGSTITVNNGVELTVDPGVVIKFSYAQRLTINGKLTADGTPEDPIIMTTFADDNVIGDTNGNGSDNAPADRPWYGVSFEDTSDDNSFVDNVTIKWANLSGWSGVRCSSASPTITNCTISNCYYGVRFEGDSDPTFTGNTIGSSQITPVAMSFEADPIFSNNSFSTSDNTYDAIGLIGGTMATNGNIVKRDFTTIPNVTYVLLESIEVPSGISLTIEDGVVIKALSGQYIAVDGTLNATGSSDGYVAFTSVNDDNYGNPNDTRNDGNDQIPAIGNFGGILFGANSTSSVLDSVLVKFGRNTLDFDPIAGGTQSYSGAISINSSNVTITDSRITDADYGIVLRNSNSTISSTEIINTTFAPIRMSLSSMPTFSNMVFTSVGWRGIAILDEYVSYNATLAKRDVAGLSNVTYIIAGDGLRIQDGAQVTINPGLNIKIDQYDNITVFGGLKVAGTESEPVIFTSLADDNVGASTDPTANDTQGNGNTTDPNNYKWGGIIFEGTSDDAFSSIRNAEFWYGGYSRAPITWVNAAAPVDKVDIKFAYAYGLYLENSSNPLVDSVFIQSSGQDPIALSFFANPTFSNMTFDANLSNGLFLIETVLSSNATVRKRNIAGISNIAYKLGNLDINSGATLTINAGVVLKLQGSQLNVYEGAIQAIGSASEPIIFTSISDDSRGGDTNNDGNGSVPAVGNWGGIDIRTSSLQSHFDHCEFRYGGSARQQSFPKYESDVTAHVASHSNNAIIENSVIQLCSSNAFGIYGTSTASISNNQIENICSTCVPVHMSMFANPTFSNNTVENIGRYAIEIRDETFSQNATFPFRSFAGVDSITYITNSPDIASGTEITIPAGMVFKALGAIDVEGKLTVAGTEQDPVVFTMLGDDEYGRPSDTESNGFPTSSIRGAVNFIVFKNISDDASTVQHALFRNNTYSFFSVDNSIAAIKLESASPTIDNNIFEFCDEAIDASGLSEPIIRNNVFRELDRAPLLTSLVSWPSEMSGNVIEGNTWKGIRIRNETLTQDTTLVRRSFAGINNIPYIFSRYKVGTGVKLTINPGVVLKFHSKPGSSWGFPGNMIVEGALSAIGGPDSDSTIIFTDFRDKFYGGDTDGQTSFSLQSWSGITFENLSSDSESKLKHVIVKGSAGDGIQLNSASPTLENVVFVSNNQWGLDVTGASDPTITACDFYDNGSPTFYGGLSNTGSFQVSALNSWWGDNSGPYHATDNVAGTGQTISGNVVFDPWAMDNSLNPITGDISLNGNVTAFDAALGLQAVATLITLNDRQEIAGDVSGNDAVSAMDASYILQYAAGLIQWFPAEAENKRVDIEFAPTYSDIQVALGDFFLDEGMEFIEIPMTLSNVKDLYAFESVIALDPLLEFVEFKQTGWTDEVQLTRNFLEDKNELRMAFALVAGLDEDKELGTLILRPKQTLTRSALEVTVNRAVGNETEVTQQAVSGTITVASTILSADLGAEFTVYPNPASNYLDIQLPQAGDYQITLHDLNGREILHQELLNASSLQLSFKNLGIENGVYLLKVHSQEATIEHKVIINR